MFSPASSHSLKHAALVDLRSGPLRVSRVFSEGAGIGSWNSTQETGAVDNRWITTLMVLLIFVLLCIRIRVQCVSGQVVSAPDDHHRSTCLNTPVSSFCVPLFVWLLVFLFLSYFLFIFFGGFFLFYVLVKKYFWMFLSCLPHLNLSPQKKIKHDAQILRKFFEKTDKCELFVAKQIPRFDQ